MDVKYNNYLTMLGKYIGNGMGVIELYNYTIVYHIGKVTPIEKLLEFIND